LFDFGIIYLVFINQQSWVSFLGSISDKQICQDSGFYDFVKPGDHVLADRGFTIEKELADKNAKLTIPPFLINKTKLSRDETRKTKIIAKARIHIERFNQRFKQWKMLEGIVPHYDFPVISQVIYVACMLANLDPPMAYKS